MVVYFGNFPALNLILRNIESQKLNQKSIESSILPYLASLPGFYLKFIKIFFDKLRLEISYSSLENAANWPVHAVQVKLENSRAAEKKNIQKLLMTNIQLHRNNQTNCCAIYSPHYPTQVSSTAKAQTFDHCQQYFSSLLGQLF